MFDSLQDRLGEVFSKLTRRGALSEEDVTAALREVRVALLEADVALPVVKDFIDAIKDKAVGQQVFRSVAPGQQVIKVVHDHLVEFLGREAVELETKAGPPTIMMLVGLQGSGKTTTSAKIARRLFERERKKVIMASLDVRRPAAQEQLRVLGEQSGIATLPVVPGQSPVAIAKRAVQTGSLEGYDIILLDTAGRLSIDEELMEEVAAIKAAAKPHEILLVADAMTGQDAVGVAERFHEKLNLSGIVLTRIDGDARGGAALSMRAVTGCPIKLLGTGEKLDALEAFHPDRIASRILGMGDVVSLVEKVQETFEKEEAEKLARKLKKGSFDLEDMATQLRQMQKLGGLSGLMSMLPGINKSQMQQIQKQSLDDTMVKRQLAIISSMTPAERTKPELIKASRRQRIAKGSGTSVQDVNKLLKQFTQANKMMKRVSKMEKKGKLPGGLGGLLGADAGPGDLGGGLGGGGLPPGFPGPKGGGVKF